MCLPCFRKWKVVNQHWKKMPTIILHAWRCHEDVKITVLWWKGELAVQWLIVEVWCLSILIEILDMQQSLICYFNFRFSSISVSKKNNFMGQIRCLVVRSSFLVCGMQSSDRGPSANKYLRSCELIFKKKFWSLIIFAEPSGNSLTGDVTLTVLKNYSRCISFLSLNNARCYCLDLLNTLKLLSGAVVHKWNFIRKIKIFSFYCFSNSQLILR